MKIYVKLKSIGKKRPILENTPMELPDGISTLREILTEVVHNEVQRYNRKETDVQLIPFLTAEEVEAQAETGKVGFGRIWSDKKADPEQAVENAVQCWKDGMVRVFCNETELESLDEPVTIQEGDCFTFIRLTFLAGRMW